MTLQERVVSRKLRKIALWQPRELNYQPNPLARALRSGYAVARSEFDSRSMSGALVIMDAGNFLLAMNAIQRAGLRVPDDVSIVEFDRTAALGDSAKWRE